MNETFHYKIRRDCLNNCSVRVRASGKCSGGDPFASPMLGHAERFSRKFDEAGEYNYMFTPHPYMRGIVRVVKR